MNPLPPPLTPAMGVLKTNDVRTDLDDLYWDVYRLACKLISKIR